MKKRHPKTCTCPICDPERTKARLITTKQPSQPEPTPIPRPKRK